MLTLLKCQIFASIDVILFPRNAFNVFKHLVHQLLRDEGFEGFVVHVKNLFSNGRLDSFAGLSALPK
jgi:hypothetical protein